MTTFLPPPDPLFDYSGVAQEHSTTLTCSKLLTSLNIKPTDTLECKDLQTRSAYANATEKWCRQQATDFDKPFHLNADEAPKHKGCIAEVSATGGFSKFYFNDTGNTAKFEDDSNYVYLKKGECGECMEGQVKKDGNCIDAEMKALLEAMYQCSDPAHASHFSELANSTLDESAVASTTNGSQLDGKNR